MDFEGAITKVQEISKDPFGAVENFLFSKLSNELESLASEPWMSEDDLVYVRGVQESLSNGKHQGTLRKALITTAICVPINNGPFFVSLIGSAALSALAGEDPALASAKSIGTGATTALISQAISGAIMFASHPPKSLSAIPLSLAIIAPSLIFLPVPGHTIATNLLGSLTLQKPEEFYRLTVLEGKKMKYHLKNGLLSLAGQYKGIIS